MTWDEFNLQEQKRRDAAQQSMYQVNLRADNTAYDRDQAALQQQVAAKARDDALNHQDAVMQQQNKQQQDQQASEQERVAQQIEDRKAARKQQKEEFDAAQTERARLASEHAQALSQHQMDQAIAQATARMDPDTPDEIREATIAAARDAYVSRHGDPHAALYGGSPVNRTATPTASTYPTPAPQADYANRDYRASPAQPTINGQPIQRRAPGIYTEDAVLAPPTRLSPQPLSVAEMAAQAVPDGTMGDAWYRRQPSGPVDESAFWADQPHPPQGPLTPPEADRPPPPSDFADQFTRDRWMQEHPGQATTDPRPEEAFWATQHKAPDPVSGMEDVPPTDGAPGSPTAPALPAPAKARTITDTPAIMSYAEWKAAKEADKKQSKADDLADKKFDREAKRAEAVRAHKAREAEDVLKAAQTKQHLADLHDKDELRRNPTRDVPALQAEKIKKYGPTLAPVKYDDPSAQEAQYHAAKLEGVPLPLGINQIQDAEWTELAKDAALKKSLTGEQTTSAREMWMRLYRPTPHGDHRAATAYYKMLPDRQTNAVPTAGSPGMATATGTFGSASAPVDSAVTPPTAPRTGSATTAPVTPTSKPSKPATITKDGATFDWNEAKGRYIERV